MAETGVQESQELRGGRRAVHVEPWLRGTLEQVDSVRRQVLHALELVGEDAEQWCLALTDDEVNARPFGVTPVAFHVRHMGRSLDRLLTYAEGRQLSAEQMEALHAELAAGARAEEVLEELRGMLGRAAARIAALGAAYEEHRGVGRQRLPSTVGGLLVHCAEHTQRHAGQMVTTASMLLGMRESSTKL